MFVAVTIVSATNCSPIHLVHHDLVLFEERYHFLVQKGIIIWCWIVCANGLSVPTLYVVYISVASSA